MGLLDWPASFPKVWGLPGRNIYLDHSHLDRTPPADPDSRTRRAARHPLVPGRRRGVGGAGGRR